jgi:hypothetical protein
MAQRSEPAEPAVMEDLDPAPSRAGASGLRPELLLGVLVLVGVLGFAGWDWWRQERQERAYSAGQRAAAALRWEEARAAFAAAEDFQDAPQRAAAAATAIATRDEQYTAAEEALAHGDPLGALAALRAVEDLQPGYRDSAALRAQVEPAVYAGALGGVVVLRPQADPPGLYVYNASGWQWLRDSDATSRVLASAPPYVLYDSPVPAAPGPPRRHLIRATLTDGRPRIDRFALNPAEFAAYRVGAAGIWAIRSPLDLPGDLARVDGFNMYSLAYQVVSSPRGKQFSLPNPRWVVLDMAADGRRYLLADLTDATRRSPRSTLYLGDAYGAAPRPLTTIPGMVLRARFSPDEHTILLHTTQPAARPDKEVQLVLLLDANGAPPARLLHDQTVDRGVTTGSDNTQTVAATFLTRGPRAGQVLLLTAEESRARLILHDPAQPDLPPQPIWTDPGPNVMIVLRESATDGGLVFRLLKGPGRPRSAGLVYVDGANRAGPLVPAVGRGRMYTGWIHAGRLVVLSTSRAPDTTTGTLFVSSLPLDALRPDPTLADPADPAAPISVDLATLIYQTPTRNWNPLTTGLLHLGPGYLATVAPDGLHAHPYDAARDVLLEPGVTTLYPIDPATDPLATIPLP